MNILLTSVGRRTYMISYFKDALDGIGLVHAANSTDTYAIHQADKYVITPLIYDDNYIEFLLIYCLKHNIGAIISFFDIDLPILAANKAKFSGCGVRLLISDCNTIQICNDKWLTYEFLSNNGFCTPQTFLTLSECSKALESKEVEFPLMIKPRWGMGSMAIFQVDNMDELRVLYKKVKNIIVDSYLKYESNLDPEKCVIIQEKLIGNEYGLDVFNDLEGNFLACVPKIKLAMREGETFSAKIVDDAQLLGLGMKLSLKLKHLANLDVDCFKVDNGYCILEMNCRFGGQYPFSHLAGVNFPKAIVQMLLGNPTDENLLKMNVGTIGIKDFLLKEI